ncbi:MAG: hypothetical protein QXS20_02435 [Candidatus Thorarchaeota archaeon]
MRYALGVFLGALLSGVIFLGAAAIRLAGFGLTDSEQLRALWDLFKAWYLVCILVLVVPPILVYFLRRSLFREWLVFEIGGVSFFSPLWLLLSAEIAGTPVSVFLTEGASSALPFLDQNGNIVGVDVGPLIIIPMIIISLGIGLIMLRPSLVKRLTSPAEKPAAQEIGPKTKATAAKKEPQPTAGPTVPSDDELPRVSAPVPDERSMNEMRSVLAEIGASPQVSDALIRAGIGTIEQLTTTRPEKLASLAGIGIDEARRLSAQIMKRLTSA